MKWRPWPPLISKKFEVKIYVGKLENLVCEVASSAVSGGGSGGVSVEIRWKGPPKIALSSFRKTVKRNCTKEEMVKNGPNGGVLVEWDEEFQSLCNLSGYKDNVFHPWEIAFTVLNVRKNSLFFKKNSVSYLMSCLRFTWILYGVVTFTLSLCVLIMSG